MIGHTIKFVITKEFEVDDIWSETNEEAQKILEDSIDIVVKIGHAHDPGISTERTKDIRIVSIEENK